MKKITEIVTAIMLFSLSLGLISFMVTVGTLLAPVAILILGVTMVYLVMKELEEDKPKKKKKRRR